MQNQRRQGSKHTAALIYDTTTNSKVWVKKVRMRNA